MGVALSQDGTRALTASFDNSVGFWDVTSGIPKFLEGHEASAKAVVFAGETAAISAGDDFAIEVWDLQNLSRIRRLEGHKGKIMSLAFSSEQNRIASASWDGTAAIWDFQTGERLLELKGHSANVNDVAFLKGGGFLTASSDGTIRAWTKNGDQKRIIVRHGFGINTLTLSEVNGWLAYGAVDGGTRVIDLEGAEIIADLTLERRPILAMSASRDFSQLAVGDGQGYIMIVETSDWSISRDFKAAKNGPIWALAYSADGSSVLAGGIDDHAYFFPVNDDADFEMSALPRDFHKAPETMENGERQFRRKCSVCHSLSDVDARRAGPNLKGVFGRKAGKLKGYTFSDAMSRSDLIWSAETIDKLFDLGPDTYVPGSKMPMQRMNSVEDRRDLIEFLRLNTGD